ncbi:hypothetical protein SESBI_20160 [Sesbania bispinosa]|nr:hypothetical protein SESBI_20160 [Sesbania bispinosa]
MSSNNNMKEVHGFTSNASGFTRNIKITALINNLKRVKAICKEMPKKVCSDFKKRCNRSSNNGCILLLRDARNKPNHGHSSRHPYVHGNMSQNRQRVVEVLQSYALCMVCNHLYASDHLGRSSHPFRNFNHIEISEKTTQQWKDDFARYRGQYFPWVYPWYDRRDTIFSYGDFPNVPPMRSGGA